MSLTKIFTTLFPAAFLLATLVAAVQPIVVEAAATDNVSGYAWSENIGWISMNSLDVPASPDYGVTVNTLGTISGYAWSEHVGWISFDRGDLSGCPSGSCVAQLNRATGVVTGWARALSAVAAGVNSGGWDGWISLSGTALDGAPYGVAVDNSCDWSGWAWGSSVVGWIDFGNDGGNAPGVTGSASACLGPVFTAPDIVVENVSVVGLLQEGEQITFSADIRNIADSMTTENTYGYRVASESENMYADGGVYDMVQVGNYLYAAVYTISAEGLRIYDVSDPENIIKVGGVVVPGGDYPNQIEVRGNYAYIGARGNADNVKIYDISNPTNPVLVNTFTTALPSFEVLKIDESYLFTGTANGNAGFPMENLEVFDITDPVNPVKTASITEADTVPNFTVGNGFLYKLSVPVSGGTKLKVYDLNSLALVNELDLPDLSPVGVNKIDLFGDDTLYISLNGSDDFAVVDVSDPANLILLDRIDFSDFSTNSNLLYGGGISHNDRYAFVGNVTGFAGVNAVDVSVPYSAQLVGHAGGKTSGYAHVSYEYGNQQYLFAGGLNGVRSYGLNSLVRFCVDNPNCATSNIGRVHGDSNTGRLANGMTYSTSTTWSTAVVGSHVLYVCADAVDLDFGFDSVSELDESNNCASYPFTISEAPPAPNLSADVGSLATSVTFDRTTGHYDYFTINYNIFNDGTTEALESVLRFNIDYGGGGFDEVVNVSIPSIMNGSDTGTQSINLGSDIPPGPHMVEILVDAADDVLESNEDDNIFVRQINVGYPDPDISLTTDPDRLVRAGNAIDLHWDLNGAGYIGSCEIEGPSLGGPETVYSGGLVTSGTLSNVGPINNKSEFILRCVAVDGSTIFTDTAVIETTGTVEEI